MNSWEYHRQDAGEPQARMPALPLTPKERPVYTIADQMAAKLYIDATLVVQTSGTSDQVIEKVWFFPLPLGGVREGAKLDADRPSPQPSPKGTGSTDFRLL